ncbi:MAG: hypothetical protein Q7S32_01705 [bacterium]|nr:hypothetical protein [bacterium]
MQTERSTQEITKVNLEDSELLNIIIDQHSVSKILSQLGLIGSVKDEKIPVLVDKIRSRLEDLLGVETLFFEDTCLVKSDPTQMSASGVFGPEQDRRYEMPIGHIGRFGKTRVHDDVYIFWERRSISEYVHDGNGFPKRIINLLERLQSLGLPLGISLTVWTPAKLYHAGGVQADPILVIEFSPQICIGLMRWNPTL